ncbi:MULTISPECIES: hypothetical protein [Demequina]|uniref:hypothetical protein n=1 Tax=Demequina TaxID=577469 RepID=UPI000783CC47|nr:MULTISPECIES: hypothetical protein [Demequina]
MTQIQDMFNEGFRSHADAVARSGGLGRDFERGAVKSIRRRRTTRAVGTGAGSALAIGAVGAAVWAVPGGRNAPVAPAGADACEINPYLPPNLDSIASPYGLFRVYVDLRPEIQDKKVVVVYPDGKYLDVPANDDGAYILDYDGREYEVANQAPRFSNEFDYAMVMDWQSDGTAGGDIWDGVNPYLVGYGWTTVVTDPVPDGIDVDALSSTFDITINGGGTGYWEGAVPEGAVTDVMVTSEGGVETTRLHEGDPGPSLEEVVGATRVEMRVSGLPGGETFSIVSTFDPNDIPEPTCLPGAADPTSIPEPTASLWGGVPPSMAPDQPGDAVGDADPSQVPTPGSGSSPDPGISSSTD